MSSFMVTLPLTSVTEYVDWVLLLPRYCASGRLQILSGPAEPFLDYIGLDKKKHYKIAVKVFHKARKIQV